MSRRGRDPVGTSDGPSLYMIPATSRKEHFCSRGADQFKKCLVSFADDHDIDVFVAGGLLRHGCGVRPTQTIGTLPPVKRRMALASWSALPIWVPVIVEIPTQIKSLDRLF